MFVIVLPVIELPFELLPSENIQPSPPVSYQVFLWDRILASDDAVKRGSLTAEQALDRLEVEVRREVRTLLRFGFKEDADTLPPPASDEKGDAR